jgi:hypothetical protein
LYLVIINLPFAEEMVDAADTSLGLEGGRSAEDADNVGR